MLPAASAYFSGSRTPGLEAQADRHSGVLDVEPVAGADHRQHFFLVVVKLADGDVIVKQDPLEQGAVSARTPAAASRVGQSLKMPSPSVIVGSSDSMSVQGRCCPSVAAI